MKNLSLATDIGTDANFLNGNLVDDQTEINAFVNQDLVQFFQKIAGLASITFNDLEDNETNGYQLLTALEFVVRSYVASTTEKGTVEKATQTEMNTGVADKFVDSALFTSTNATTVIKGTVEKATSTEVENGTADKFIDAALFQSVNAAEGFAGTVEKATTSEAQTGVANKFLDAALLQLVTATTSRAGVQENATTVETRTNTANKTVQPSNLIEHELYTTVTVFGHVNMSQSAVDPIRYKRLVTGLIEITGRFDVDTSIATTLSKIFTLPAGYESPIDTYFTIYDVSSGTVVQTGRVVNGDRGVYVEGAITSGTYTIHILYLEV